MQQISPHNLLSGLSQLAQSVTITDNSTLISTTTSDSETCLVEGTFNEYYDCCTNKALKICSLLTYLDYLSAAVVLLTFILIWRRISWLENQILMIYIFALLFVLFICKTSHDIFVHTLRLFVSSLIIFYLFEIFLNSL